MKGTFTPTDRVKVPFSVGVMTPRRVIFNSLCTNDASQAAAQLDWGQLQTLRGAAKVPITSTGRLFAPFADTSSVVTWLTARRYRP
jgi:hypothetical protein